MLTLDTSKVEKSVTKCVSEQKDLKGSQAGLPKHVKTLQGILDDPSLRITANNKTSPTPPNNAQTQPSDQSKRRISRVLTSSIENNTPVEKLQSELNADIKIHTTYFFEKNKDLSESDAYLAQKVNE